MSVFYLTQFKIEKFTLKHINNLTYLVVAVVVTKSQNFSWFTKKNFFFNRNLQCYLKMYKVCQVHYFLGINAF